MRLLADHCACATPPSPRRHEAWRMRQVSMAYGDQSAQLKEVRAADPDGPGRRSFTAQRRTLRRLNVVFPAHFERRRKAEKVRRRARRAEKPQGRKGALRGPRPIDVRPCCSWPGTAPSGNGARGPIGIAGLPGGRAGQGRAQRSVAGDDVAGRAGRSPLVCIVVREGDRCRRPARRGRRRRGPLPDHSDGEVMADQRDLHAAQPADHRPAAAGRHAHAKFKESPAAAAGPRRGGASSPQPATDFHHRPPWAGRRLDAPSPSKICGSPA